MNLLTLNSKYQQNTLRRGTQMYASHKISQGNCICKDHYIDMTERNLMGEQKNLA